MIESSKPIRIRQLSAHLPHDIVIWAEVPLDPSCNNFHPSKSAVTKTYSYYAPLESNAIDLDGVQESLNMLLGQHDFANFGKKDPSRPKSHTVRVLHDADVGILEDEWHGVLRFRFTSDGFLWQQCRRMVTHLLDVGYNRTDPGFTKVLLEANSAVEKPFPQNPHGLVLEHIECPSIPKGKEISSYSLDRFLKHLSALLRNAATQKAVLQGLEESFLESERGTRRGC
jgi:tRNA pseudouridine(38-40) synthase